MKALRDIFTGVDGVTHDVGRYYAALAGVGGVGLAAYDVIANHAHFDVQAYGIGMASLAAGVGAFIKLKAQTEPSAAAHPPQE